MLAIVGFLCAAGCAMLLGLILLQPLLKHLHRQDVLAKRRRLLVKLQHQKDAEK